MTPIDFGGPMVFPPSYGRDKPEEPDVVSCPACGEDRYGADEPCPHCGNRGDGE